MKFSQIFASLLIVSSASSLFAQTTDSFLTVDQAPNSLQILPPPPAFDSVAFLNDKTAYEQTRILQGTPRWQQAIQDADLSDANIGKPFNEAFGIEISPINTPITYEILRKLRTDSGGFATKSAKEHYMRMRPFVFFNTHSCTPNDEATLSKNGSYPSGHTTIGWSTALILAELRPDRQNEILKRGYEFGQSRVVCGVHWQSDVDAGRITGSAEVARLHANPQFVKMLEDARLEIQKKLK